MRRANIYVDGQFCGNLVHSHQDYIFEYLEGYRGLPVSLSMPLTKKRYCYTRFPPFFDGLLPEGVMLENLLRKKKIDRSDKFSILISVGQDLVGNVTVMESK